jgi:hypothetical protein
MDFLEGTYNIVPLLAPVDNVAAETATAYIDLKLAQDACFLVTNGLITSASATDMVTVTLEAATGVTGTEAAIAYNYRISAAVGANTWGDIATAAATGIELDPAANDNMFLLVDANPVKVQAEKADARYVRIRIGTAADMGAHLVGVVAFIKPRYKQDVMTSATAAASA